MTAHMRLTQVHTYTFTKGNHSVWGGHAWSTGGQREASVSLPAASRSDETSEHRYPLQSAWGFELHQRIQTAISSHNPRSQPSQRTAAKSDGNQFTESTLPALQEDCRQKRWETRFPCGTRAPRRSTRVAERTAAAPSRMQQTTAPVVCPSFAVGGAKPRSAASIK